METNNTLDRLVTDLDPTEQFQVLHGMEVCVLKMSRCMNLDTSDRERQRLEREVLFDLMHVYAIYEKKIGSNDAEDRFQELCDLIGLQPGVRVKTTEMYERAGEGSAPLNNVLKVSEKMIEDIRNRLI